MALVANELLTLLELSCLILYLFNKASGFLAVVNT